MCRCVSKTLERRRKKHVSHTDVSKFFSSDGCGGGKWGHIYFLYQSQLPIRNRRICKKRERSSSESGVLPGMVKSPSRALLFQRKSWFRRKILWKKEFKFRKNSQEIKCFNLLFPSVCAMRNDSVRTAAADNAAPPPPLRQWGCRILVNHLEIKSRIYAPDIFSWRYFWNRINIKRPNISIAVE